MHTIIFATNNEHKIKEIQSLVGSDFTIITLKEADDALLFRLSW